MTFLGGERIVGFFLRLEEIVLLYRSSLHPSRPLGIHPPATVMSPTFFRFSLQSPLRKPLPSRYPIPGRECRMKKTHHDKLRYLKSVLLQSEIEVIAPCPFHTKNFNFQNRTTGPIWLQPVVLHMAEFTVSKSQLNWTSFVL